MAVEYYVMVLVYAGSRVDGRHVGPVWQLEWVNRQSSEDDTPHHEETLVSVSGDGRVVQWAIRKEIQGSSESLRSQSSALVG